MGREPYSRKEPKKDSQSCALPLAFSASARSTAEMTGVTAAPASVPAATSTPKRFIRSVKSMAFVSRVAPPLRARPKGRSADGGALGAVAVTPPPREARPWRHFALSLCALHLARASATAAPAPPQRCQWSVAGPSQKLQVGCRGQRLHRPCGRSQRGARACCAQDGQGQCRRRGRRASLRGKVASLNPARLLARSRAVYQWCTRASCGATVARPLGHQGSVNGVGDVQVVLSRCDLLTMAEYAQLLFLLSRTAPQRWPAFTQVVEPPGMAPRNESVHPGGVRSTGLRLQDRALPGRLSSCRGEGLCEPKTTHRNRVGVNGAKSSRVEVP
mmetsp:Transcript_1300/g.3827  ORF Transcript_1300/g.3827 Transcript_1300/m.3827 type:complete len:330 (-) Transcript_1300:403-1392(-)